MVASIEIFSTQIDKVLSKGFKGFNIYTSLNEVGKYQVKSTQNNFTKQSDPSGKPWKPLSPLTIKKKGFSTILIDKDKMRKANYYKVTGTNSVEIANRQFYSDYHQRGTKKMAKREFIGISLKDAKEITKIFDKNLKKYLNA